MPDHYYISVHCDGKSGYFNSEDNRLETSLDVSKGLFKRDELPQVIERIMREQSYVRSITINRY